MQLVLPDDPYSPAIRQFLMQSFPAQISGNQSELIDALTETIVASGQVRYGPRPSPESLVAIRNVIRHNVTANVPLRFVSPWGSEKPNGTGIDIAEVMAIKTFICLNDRVKKHYSPGIEMRLRVEDASAPHLFFERHDAARDEAKLYTDGLRNLVSILEVPWLFVANDLQFTSEVSMEAAADALLPYFEKHLAYPSDESSLKSLNVRGWQGGAVPWEMVEFYMKSYDKLYPGMAQDEKLHRLARYFAGSLARHQLGLSGAKKEWGKDYMEVYFGTTPPGGRLNVHSRRVHYRTMPSNITSMHMAPWRSKGYLRVGEETISASLASFHEDKQYNPLQITFENNGLKQVVQTDYIIV